MLNSRNIDDLRPDVAANCRVFLELCKNAGLQVLVTATVRDEEYQRKCYDDGTAATPYPSFHGIKAGLAFDICKNVKGQEYNDLDFFKQVADIGKQIGFEWGGDWKSFPDKPHFQWSEHGKYTSSMVRAGKLPPTMPLYQKEEEMTQDQFDTMVNDYFRRQSEKKPNTWALNSWEKAIQKGVFDGTMPQGPLTREQAAMVFDRLGLLERK